MEVAYFLQQSVSSEMCRTSKRNRLSNVSFAVDCGASYDIFISNYTNKTNKKIKKA